MGVSLKTPIKNKAKSTSGQLSDGQLSKDENSTVIHQKSSNPPIHHQDKTLIQRKHKAEGNDPTRINERKKSAPSKVSKALPSEDPTQIVQRPVNIGKGYGEQVKVGAVLKGRFKLETIIGMGGMGIVFKAKDLLQEETGDLDPYIALKVLSPQLVNQKKFLIAMQQETKKTQRLSHPNIVKAYDFDRDGKTAFMTMELLQGEPLNKRISENTLSRQTALHIIKSLIRGLSYAHENGIVHADFKPNNVFIEKNGTVKIFDFGIAQAVGVEGERKIGNKHFNAADLEAVTPRYASIGALKGEPIKPSDDYYALGCVIYMVLAGHHPYGKKDAIQVKAEKIKPKPIDGLTSEQWNALSALIDVQSVAPKSLKPLEHAFFPSKQTDKRSKLLAVGLGTVVFLTASWFGASWYQDYSLLGEAKELLHVASSTSFQPLFNELNVMDSKRQTYVVQALKDNLLDVAEQQLEKQLNLEDKDFDIAAAEKTLGHLRKYYPDSARIAAIEGPFRDRKQEAEAFLSKQLNGIRANQQYLPTDSQWDLTSVVSAYRKTNASDLPEIEQLVLTDYVRFIKERLFYQEYGTAKLALKSALMLYPQSAELSSLSQELSAKKLQIGTAEAGSGREDRSRYQVNQNRLKIFDKRNQELISAREKYLTGGELDSKKIKSLLSDLEDTRSVDYYALKISLKKYLDEAISTTKDKAYLQLARELFPESYESNKKTARKRNTCYRSLANKGADKKSRCYDLIGGKYRGPELVVLKGDARVRSFAMTAREVSNSEFRIYCQLKKSCSSMPPKNNKPITGLSAGQAKAYTRWLSSVTDFKYRLPQAKEWKLASTAETSVKDHNCLINRNGKLIRGGSIREVGQGYMNGFGLQNMFGNVAEMVVDGGRMIAQGGSYNTVFSACESEQTVLSKKPASEVGLRLVRQL